MCRLVILLPLLLPFVAATETCEARSRCRGRQVCCVPECTYVEYVPAGKSQRTASNIMVRGDQDAAAVSPNNVVNDKDDRVEVTVDVDLDGWQLASGFPKLKVFPNMNDAKIAAIDPSMVTTGGPFMTMTQVGSTNQYKAPMVFVAGNAPVGADGNNNWIVVWTGTTQGDQFYKVHRLPAKGQANGWNFRRPITSTR